MKAKNISFIIGASGLLMPFVLLTDIYPFARFGMFAEPARQMPVSEQFIICYQDWQSRICVISSEELGIPEGHFAYIARRYYYQQKSHQFIREIAKLAKSKYPYQVVFLCRVAQGDTSRISTVLPQ